MSNPQPSQATVAAQLKQLLPTPRRLTGGARALRLPAQIRLEGPFANQDLPALATSTQRLARHHCQLVSNAAAESSTPRLRVNLSSPPNAAPDLPSISEQGYTLSISASDAASDQLGEITITAASVVGVSYALATLNQLLLHTHAQLPEVRIDDEPRWAMRGVSYDVSRGRVPTLATLFEFVDRMAALKINHLQLYMEHTFAFAFDPQISAGASPLTPDELRQLDEYCTARHVLLAPSLGLFGHMGRILSLPQYTHLAEIPNDKDWWSQSWNERTRGLTLDVSQAESHQLVENMLNDVLPVFRGPLVNLGCDESWDLGKGRGAAATEQRGRATLYREHLERLGSIAKRHGKQPLFWGDMFKSLPEALQGLPSDWIPVNWDYRADGDYEGIQQFATFAQRWVAPGTQTWNRCIADIVTAEINVQRHVGAAQEFDATGVLMTDWGDHGHVAPPACAWPGITMAANLSWNPEGLVGSEFDRAYEISVLEWHGGQHSGQLLAAWRDAVAICDKPRIWPRFYCLDEPANTIENAEEFDQDENLARIAAAEAACRAAETYASDAPDIWERSELALAFQLHLLAMRWERLRQPEYATTPARQQSSARQQFADEIRAWTKPYAETWLAKHKPSQLDEVLKAVQHVGAAALD